MERTPRILVLDGDAPRAEVLSLVLRQRMTAQVEAPSGALAAADALRGGSFDAVVIAPLPGASTPDLVARSRAACPQALVILLVPALDEAGVRDALALRVDDVVVGDAGAPLRVAACLARLQPQTLEEHATVPGRRAPSRVDDAPTQQMPALQPRGAAQIAGQGPALEPLLAAAGIATFQAGSDGRILRTSAAVAERLGPENSPCLGIAPDEWAALVDEANTDGVATRSVLAGASAERRVSVTLLRTEGGTLDGLLQDRSETEALWQRLEALRLAEGDSGGDVIALDERRAQRLASTDPGAPAPQDGGWRRELALASHDLQEPVRSMRIYAELLEEQLGPSLKGEARELVAQGRAAAQRAEAMLGEVVARAAGEVLEEVDDADAEAVLAEVLVNLRGAIAESDASITHGPLPRLGLPPRELAQILQNLVGNALKYRGARVPRVHVAADREGDGWRITVADNGRGIDSDFLPRVFEMFQRGPGADDRPGSGIGLAVCKQVLESRGGNIEVTSTLSEGSTFTLHLPDSPAVAVKNVNI